MPAVIEITGDKKLDSVFANLAKKVQKKVLRKPIRDATKAIAGKAKALVPRDSGDLAKAITVRAGNVKKGGKTGQPRGGIGFRLHIKEEKIDFETGKGFYPTHLELGTSHQAPKPYLRPALASAGPAARDKALQAIKRNIEAAAKGAL